MKLSAEQLKRLSARMKRDMLGKTSASVMAGRPRMHGPLVSGKKIVIAHKGVSAGKKGGRDVPLSQTQSIDKALSKTHRVHEGEVAEALKSTYELGFPDNALTSLRSLSERGMRPLCFTLEGIAAYPFLFLADQSVYGSEMELFWGLAERAVNADATMDYDCDSYRAVTDEIELWKIFSRFESNDKSFFFQALKDINARIGSGTLNEWVYFIGHDKRRFQA